jgi:hypothetical protein
LGANPEFDETLIVIRGRVVCHSDDRDEEDPKAVKLRPPSSAFIFTGEIPEGTAVLL